MSRTHDLFSEWPWNEVLGTTTPGFSLICMIFFLSFYKLFWNFHIRKSYRHEESHERRTWSLKERDREGSCWDKNRGREGRLALWAYLLVLCTGADLHPGLPGNEGSLFPGRMAALGPIAPSSGQDQIGGEQAARTQWALAHQADSSSLFLPQRRLLLQQPPENCSNFSARPLYCISHHRTRFTQRPVITIWVDSNHR